ncbi:hypothetical protein QFC21_006628 [Naganishia friedmannii]|uniref:Uncharacterized protein n=1 Tax=Naganishia friedmannii TaxID=89922 RepID=A0ACC2V1M6_9TREE|nr:hypothetical protein QFC21_006628 [Naganishia friedmannii]
MLIILHFILFEYNVTGLFTDAAIDQMIPYMWDFLNNNWLCLAFTLNPRVRERGLRDLFEDYAAEYEKYGGLKDRAEEVLKFMEGKMTPITSRHAGPHPSGNANPPPLSHGPTDDLDSVYTAYPVAASEPPRVPTLVWGIYNTGDSFLMANAGEGVLHYWERQSRRPELAALAALARDILGLSSSSSSVERLFSSAGLMLDRRRSSLAPDTLAEQSSLKLWIEQGFSMPK